MLKITRADGTAEKQVLETMRSRSMEVDRKVTASVAQIVDPQPPLRSGYLDWRCRLCAAGSP